MSRALDDRCRAIKAVSPGLLDWSFDDRFRAANAAFDTSVASAVDAALSTGFETHWTAATLSSAPPRVVEMAGKVGLRESQRMYTALAHTDPILFGLWWPWGSGTTISIRVLFSARSLDEAAKATLLSDFKGWFQI
jgi:hypothetical protein